MRCRYAVGPSVFVLVDRDFAREKSRCTHGNIQVSITYLMVLFIAMLADHWILGTPV